MKLCLGLPQCLPGELAPADAQTELFESTPNEEIYLGPCFPEKGFGFAAGPGLGVVGIGAGGERMEIGREVAEWIGEVTKRMVEDEEVFDGVGVFGVGEEWRSKTDGKMEIPLLRRPKGEDDYLGDEDGTALSRLRLPPIKIFSREDLEGLKLPFVRGKEEKELDGGDGGVRWTRRVKREIGEWVAGAVVGERMVGDRTVMKWVVKIVNSKEGEVLEDESDGSQMGWETLREEEVLFPLNEGGKEKIEIEIEWPPDKESMREMKSIAAGDREIEEQLLRGFQVGGIRENLQLSGEEQDVLEGTPKTTSLHIPSSPPIHHLHPLISTSSPSQPASPSTRKRRGECPTSYEDLYIEGPLTPLRSSPFSYNPEHQKSSKKPCLPITISLPPRAATPPFSSQIQETEISLPAPIISEAKYFIASLVQEQLTADDGQIREPIPIIDIDPAPLRLAAPWDGVDVISTHRDDGASNSDIDMTCNWLGLAGSRWGGEKATALELLWRPFSGKEWIGEMLKETIEGKGDGEELLEEIEMREVVERGAAEEEVCVSNWTERGFVGYESEEELEVVVFAKDKGVEDSLEKRKRGEESGMDVEGNAALRRRRQSPTRSPQVHNETKQNQVIPSTPTKPIRHLDPLLSGIISPHWGLTSPPKRYSPRVSDTGPAVNQNSTSVRTPIFKPLATAFSTSSALATFLGIRNVALPDIPNKQPSLKALPQPLPLRSPQQMPVEIIEPQIPVPILPAVLPKAQFVMSASLLQSHRGVLRIVKTLWGTKADWIEREYPLIPAKKSTTYAKPWTTNSSLFPRGPQTWEEDEAPPLLLSPMAGLYLTALHRIRKRVLLPGEKEVPGEGDSGVRESILRMSRTVERLWVLVVAARLTSVKDVEHWSCFLGFCAGVSGCDVRTVLVPYGGKEGENGGDEAVGRWVAWVMYSEARAWGRVIAMYAPWWADEDGNEDRGGDGEQEVDMDMDADAWVMRAETTGELFLREAGLNVFAAGVVLRELVRVDGEDPGGALGVMRRLLTMGQENRRRLFAGLVGEKAVGGLERRVEGSWEVRREGNEVE